MTDIRQPRAGDGLGDLIALSHGFFYEYQAHHEAFFQIDALSDEDVVAYFARTLDDDACGIIMDEGTASITGAYAVPGVRRQGVATALLRACVAWAAERGYARCAVDFESANIEANRFWRLHFAPVCYSLMRCVDEAAVAKERG